MYEKTIANDHLIFQISLPGTLTKVLSLLSPTDKIEYDNKLTEQIEGYPNGYRRVVLDGYIVSGSTIYVAHKLGGAEDSIGADVQYTFPVSNWLEKSYVRGSGNAIIRIFFS